MRPAIIATIVVLVLAVAIAIFAFTRPNVVTPIEPSVQPTGRSLEFPIGLTKQFFTQKTMAVRAGDTIVLKVTATDLDHSVSVPRYGISVAAPKGQVTTVTFVAKQGDSVVYCTDKCDPNVTMTVTAQ